MMRAISLINTKGGVGKTVTTLHLGAALAREGSRVLLIDVDLQHGLTSYLNPPQFEYSTAEVLLGACALEDAALTVRERVSLVPATSMMERAEVELTTASAGELRLRRALRHLATQDLFDYVFIDCPSGWGTVTRNALLASSALLVPINSEPAAVATAHDTITGALELAELHDSPAPEYAVLLTRFRSTNAARAVASQVMRDWSKHLCETRIRQAEKINEFTIRAATLSDMAASEAGGVGEDYANLAQEITRRFPCKPSTRKTARATAARKAVGRG